MRSRMAVIKIILWRSNNRCSLLAIHLNLPTLLHLTLTIQTTDPSSTIWAKLLQTTTKPNHSISGSTLKWLSSWMEKEVNTRDKRVLRITEFQLIQTSSITKRPEIQTLETSLMGKESTSSRCSMLIIGFQPIPTSSTTKESTIPILATLSVVRENTSSNKWLITESHKVNKPNKCKSVIQKWVDLLTVVVNT